MPRKQSASTPPVEVEIDTERLAVSSRAATELVALDTEAELRTHDLAVKLGYDGPLDPDVIERGVVMQMRRTVEACLESGRMLLILKERVGHGNFVQRLEKLGMAYRGAAKFMQAALKFSNVPTSAHLIESIGTQNKLLELLVLDEGEIRELAEEGSVRDIQLDEIESMSVSELRARLRDAKQTEEAKDKLIAKRDAKITKLEERLERPYQASDDAEAASAEEQAQLDAIRDAALSAQMGLLTLGKLYADLSANGASESMQTAAHVNVEYLAQRLAELINEHGIPVQFDEMVEPSWLKAAAAKAGVEKATPKPAKKS